MSEALRIRIYSRNTLSRDVVDKRATQEYRLYELRFSLTLPLPPTSGLVTRRCNKFRGPRQPQQHFRCTCVAVPAEKEFPTSRVHISVCISTRSALPPLARSPGPRSFTRDRGTYDLLKVASTPTRAHTFSFACAMWFMFLEANARRSFALPGRRTRSKSSGAYSAVKTRRVVRHACPRCMLRRGFFSLFSVIFMYTARTVCRHIAEITGIPRKIRSPRNAKDVQQWVRKLRERKYTRMHTCEERFVLCAKRSNSYIKQMRAKLAWE